MILVEPTERLLSKHNCSAATGVNHVHPDKEFRVLDANFSRHPVHLIQGQCIATAEDHPHSLTETDISHEEMLGIAEADNMYRKRDYNAKDINLINQHLADAREAILGEDAEEPITADTVELGVDEKLQPEIRKMLRKHEHLWSGKLGKISVAQHHINLIPGARPFKSAPYRAGPKTRELEEFEVKKQLAAGVIEPSNSEWASPVLFAPKKDGRLRFCIDYRRLNTMTVKDSYPLPRMDECIDTLGDARIFTTLDAFNGYWQINVPKEDRGKTAFVCHAGQFQYTRMPFGLTNAPATFQRGLDVVLSRFKWKTCLVYIDDIIIFSKSVEEHIQHVDEILTALGNAGVTLKIKKCKFFSDTVEYLGHIIKPGNLEIDSSNTKSLREAKPPTTKTELRSFLGLCNVYRRFIKDFSTTAHPLNELLKKGSPDKFELNDAQLAAFRTFINAVCSPPVLALPKPDLPYSVDTDASEYGLGCTLFQTNEDGDRKPIGYWSRSLKPAEKNYSASERECLGVFWALLTLRPYLQFEKFLVHTDHNALKWLLNITEPSSRLTRWRLRLAEFDFEVRYKKGKDNQHADALSRLLTASPTVDNDEDEIPSFLLEETNDDLYLETLDLHATVDFIEQDFDEEDHLLAIEKTKEPQFQKITMEELLSSQHNDAFCAEISRRLNGGEKLSFSHDDNGLLVRTTHPEHQIVVPHSLKKRVLYLNHYPVLAGHPGGRKLYHRIRRHFYWPALAVDCYATVRNCPECARERLKLRKNVGELKLFPATAPNESVCIDILGELVRTPRGHRYLLVITDRFTKMTKTVPMKGVSAGEVAKHFVDNWVFNYGPPTDLLADNGKQFTSKFFLDVCRILNIHNSFTTTYHPQTNGQVERFNRTILAALRAYIHDHPKDWDLYTSALTYAYNTQPQTSTSMAPFDLVLSKPPGPLAAALPSTAYNGPLDFKHKWKKWLTKVIPETQQKLQKAQERYKKNFDKRIRKTTETIKPGDQIFLRIERKDEKETRHKLAPIAEGPFPVIRVDTSSKTVVIKRPDESVENVSRSRVALAPKAEEYGDKTRTQLATPLCDTITNYPVPEETNLQHVSNITPIPAIETPNNPPTATHDQEGNKENQSSEPPVQQKPTPNTANNTETQDEDDTEELVMDKIVSHRTNKSKKHRHAEVGDLLYRIRWYDFGPSDDTWEPIAHIPRSKVLSYHRKKKLPLPDNLDDSIDG